MSLKLIYLVVLGVGIACLAAEAVALLVIGYVRLDWDYVYKRGVIVVESTADNTSHVRPNEVDSFIVRRRKALGLCQTCGQSLCDGGGYKVCNRCGVRE